MEETLMFYVHSPEGEIVFSSPNEEEALGFGQAIAGWVTTDVVEYEENDNREEMTTKYR